MSAPNPITIDFNCPHWAYILGYLWGDGHVAKRKGSIVLGIKEDDYTVIAPSVHQAFEGRARVYRRKKRKPTWAQCVAVHISSAQLWGQLVMLGYQGKPDQGLVLERLATALHPLFWRGYFDADGTLRVRPHGSEVSFCSCYDESWKQVIQMLVGVGVTKWRLERRTNEKGHRYGKIFVERQADVIALLSYLYDGEHQMGLLRKRIKAETIKGKIRDRALSSIRVASQQAGSMRRALARSGGRRVYVSGKTETEIWRKAYALHKADNTEPYRLLEQLGVTETIACAPHSS